MDEQEIHIEGDGTVFNGTLAIPGDARGVVVFAHGSGSSRFSKRNRYVAEVLQTAGLATLLMDLLTVAEERLDAFTGELRFDISLLSERVVTASQWLKRQKATAALSIGYFGASTGAAAALVAAARLGEAIFAVVSRGGRPDLAMRELPQVKAPTLLIVGGNDAAVIPLNEAAAAELRVEHKLEIIPGATHLFEESGALEAVARLACDWFISHRSLASPS